MAERELKKAGYKVKKNGTVFDEKQNYVGCIEEFGIFRTPPFYEMSGSDSEPEDLLADKITINALAFIIKSLDPLISLELIKGKTDSFRLTASIAEKMPLAIDTYKNLKVKGFSRILRGCAEKEIEESVESFERFVESIGRGAYKRMVKASK